MASSRSRRANAGSKMASLLNSEEADEFYKDTYGGFDEVENDNEFAYHSPVEDEVDSDFSIDENDEPKSDLGTIHILRKHFFRQNKRISISTYILTKLSFCSLTFAKKKKNVQKIRENAAVDIKVLT